MAEATELQAFGAGVMCEPLRLHGLPTPKTEQVAETSNPSGAAGTVASKAPAAAKPKAKPKPRADGEVAKRRNLELITHCKLDHVVRSFDI